MINTHKELVSEVKLFCDKFELINSFAYVKEVDQLIKEVQNSEPQVFVMRLDSFDIDNPSYNNVVQYSFTIADEVMYEDDAIINSQSELMFTVSALSDYLNHIADGDIQLTEIRLNTESEGDNTYVTVSGAFDFTIKRSASYWKHMETYNA